MSAVDRGSLRFSFRRVGVLAAHAFIDAVRQRVFQFTTLLAAGLVVGSLGLRELDFGGAELKFVADFGHGALVNMRGLGDPSAIDGDPPDHRR